MAPEDAVVAVGDAKRRATVDQLVVAARLLLLERGLDVTMDDVARAAGVSRRTVFRHFTSREQLLADALESGMQRYGELLPAFDGDWHRWLHELCQAIHHVQSTYGAGYWELVTRRDLPPVLAAVERSRAERRGAAMRHIAEQLWQHAGGTTAVPRVVAATVAAHLSARFTAAVIVDGEQSWEVAAELAEDAIAYRISLEVEMGPRRSQDQSGA
jgi:AcrR family transcriptional regulator